MKNYVQPGRSVTVPTPVGGVASGDGILLGSLFGVAAYTAAEGEDLEIETEGVFDLPKTAAQAYAVGDKLYWDSATKKLTSTTSGNKWIGVAMLAAGAGDATARVLLNRIAI